MNQKQNNELAKANQPSTPANPKSTVRVLEHGIVGSLDYKIIEAGKADDLYQWLKDNKYQYSGDEATLQHYIQKKWIFTVMKIDTMQMKRNKDGTFAGDVSPTRFQFASDKIVYPLKITQISVRDKTEALFYVQAPFKVDLPGHMTYQYTWTPMLQAASGCTPGGIPGRGDEWLASYKDHIPTLLKQAQELGFNFVSGQRPGPNTKGHIPTTMEWARKLTKDDIGILTGKSPYCEKVPDVDDGFDVKEVKLMIQNNNNNFNQNIHLNNTQAIQNNFNNFQNNARVNAIGNVVRMRVAKYNKDRPFGYLVREAPADDVKNLAQLAGHLQEDGFITKFRKIFARDEMNDDLLIVPARYNKTEDTSEYEEILPTSPP
jgi:phage antirepressor YoqD-like protein